MTANRRPKRILHRVAGLLAAVAVIVSAQPAAVSFAATAQGVTGPGPVVVSPEAAPRTLPAATRIEGQVRWVEGDVLQVDNLRVVRAASTRLLEGRGTVERGAWVLVVGTFIDDYIAADLIEVLRPATAGAPTYQYTGRLRIKSSTNWFVGDVLVQVPEELPRSTDLAPDALVRVSVHRVGGDLVATEVKAVAVDQSRVPMAIEGIVQQVNDDSWVVDNHTIIVPEAQNTPVEQGDTVEVAALDEGGSLVAQQTRRVDRSHQASVRGYITSLGATDEVTQTWQMVTFDNDQPTVQAIQLTPETYIDEDRAVTGAGLEAEVEGEKTGPSSIDATLVRLDQPVPATVAGALTFAQTSALAHVGSERVWFASDQLAKQARTAAGLLAGERDAAQQNSAHILVHGVRLSNGVIIAQQVRATTGLTTALAANDVSLWQGPNYINPALTKASSPVVLFDSQGSGHAVYESQGNIYYSYQPRGGVWGNPVKIATGDSPAAVVDSNGIIHVAYRGEFARNYDIMHVRLLKTGAWTLPIRVAQTSGASADPALAADADGNVYVAWMDLTSGEWTVQLGTWNGAYWTSYPVYYGRGQSPALVVQPDGALFLAWQDRVPLGDNLFGNYEIYAAERRETDDYTGIPYSISDNQSYRPGANSIGVRVTNGSDGLLHITWVDDNTQVRYLYGKTGYWPVPHDLGPKRALVRGASVVAATDGLLYVAFDEGETVSVTRAPLHTQDWSAAQQIVTRATPQGEVSDVSLATSSDHVAVVWLQANGKGSMGIYESRQPTAPQSLKYRLPFILGE